MGGKGVRETAGGETSGWETAVVGIAGECVGGWWCVVVCFFVVFVFFVFVFGSDANRGMRTASSFLKRNVASRRR
jgi:uncharacterized membrane protein